MTGRLPLLFKRIVTVVACVTLAACVGANEPPSPRPPRIVDRSTQECAVSDDGFMWYRVPPGSFPPIEMRYARCGLDRLSQDGTPPLPRWSRPAGATQTRLVATSLQQLPVSLAGMQGLERVAAANHVPMTWMIGTLAYVPFARTYDDYHAKNGDDVQSAYFPSLHVAIARSLPWYTPRVSVASAGTERLIPQGLYRGEHAFWGITWNSRGTDGTWDYGAPWGTYCADVRSYKRPQPDGGCDVLAFEWTARDLTRAYLSGQEAAFSTDPDDLLARGGFSVSSAIPYVRSLVDAYAAAGQTQPIVMVVQQETYDAVHPGSTAILNAILAQAARDRMKTETLGQAAIDARTFSAAPRAVAFPYIPGGNTVPSSLLGASSVYPATVDYHDTKIGMSFIGGRTLPSRIFRYADYPVSRFNRPLPEVAKEEMPSLTGASAAGGWLTLRIYAPVAIRAGAAIWTNPARINLRGARAMPAGRAATILTFDLKAGTNVVRYRCGKCNGTIFDYST